MPLNNVIYRQVGHTKICKLYTMCMSHKIEIIKLQMKKKQTKKLKCDKIFVIQNL